MHTRTPRAAVDTASQPSIPAPSRFTTPPARRPLTLWASPPLQLRFGRAIGVRLIGGAVQVAFIEAGSTEMRWAAAERVLSEAQANVWARTSAFRRER